MGNIYAQEAMIIHSKSGGVKIIPFAKGPELYFDKADVIKVMTAGVTEEILYKDINMITFEDGIGDVNDDGYVNETDVLVLVEYIMGNKPDGFSEDAADVNGDGNVNIADVVALTNLIRSRQKTDLD
jgi:hypothetical protein